MLILDMVYRLVNKLINAGRQATADILVNQLVCHRETEWFQPAPCHGSITGTSLNHPYHIPSTTTAIMMTMIINHHISIKQNRHIAT